MSPRRKKLRRQSRIELAIGILAGLAPYLICAAIVLFSDLAPARGQDLPRREIHTYTPDLDGTRASAPIPARYHVRNEGGSDRAGLCVISSVLAAGMSQGVPGLNVPGHEMVMDPATGRMVPGRMVPGKGSSLWKAAKRRPGGYSPDKLQRLLQETVPDEKYASYVGTDLGVVETLVGKGYPVAATMNTGELYGMKRIHHMVDVGHLDRRRDLAMIEDNNRPGIYTWMTAREYGRRFVDGDMGWAFAWLRKAATSTGTGPVAAFVAVAGVVAILAALAIRRARAESAAGEMAGPDFDGYPYEWT